ncbi:MAG: PASTA domain-containing protein, partial [Wujia sp.]
MEQKLCMGCMKKYSVSYDVCPHCGYVDGTAPKEAYHLVPGTVLQEKYIVGKVVGYGGFGVTYMGYNRLLDQKVAIKEFLPGEFATRCSGESQVTIFSGESEEQFADGIVKFIEEARRLAKFKNVPGIVTIYDSFTANKTAYIVMEFLEGETLKEKLEREEKLPLDEALNLMVPVLDALKQVHKEGILHRDISPDNIFITDKGGVKLLDFGAARYATTTHSKSLSVIVKPGYAPQEQYRSRGDQGTWTDVYSCAATLYRMITGVTPEDSMERGNKDTLVPPSKLGIKIPKNKENAIMNALNLKIEDRTRTVEDFEEDLTTENTVKRNKIKFKKADIGRWPLWVKISSSIVASAIAIFLLLLVTGVVNFGSINVLDKGELENGEVYVPNVVNFSLPDAEKKIEDSRLIVQIVDKQNSDIIPKDMVLYQNIIDGEIVLEGTVLELTISAGGEIIYMPDLTGMKCEDAEAILEELGLLFDMEEDENEMAPGYVFNQDIEEGTPIEKGSRVKLYVSLGIGDIDESQTTIVPDVTGESLEQAKTYMSEAKLYIYVLSYEYSTSVPKGDIISQDIASGSEVNQGTRVGVVVSKGKEMTRVPDVQFKTLSEAQNLLTTNKLKCNVQYEENNSVAKDHVIRQSVEPGTEVDLQTVITIYISKGNPAAENAPTYQPSNPPVNQSD